MNITDIQAMNITRPLNHIYIITLALKTI